MDGSRLIVNRSSLGDHSGYIHQLVGVPSGQAPDGVLILEETFEGWNPLKTKSAMNHGG